MTKIGSNTQFSGAQFGITVIDNHCYAYSGSITPAGSSNPDTTALSFTTGKYYCFVEINWTSISTSATVDQYVQMTMNDIIIYNAQSEDDESATNLSPVKLLIPPLSKFEIKVGDPAANPVTVLLAGKVYR